MIILRLYRSQNENEGANLKNKKMINLRDDRTQKYVAQEIGISQSTYSMIEGGHRFPRKELQFKLACYFKTTADDLFFSHIDHDMRTKGD